MELFEEPSNHGEPYSQLGFYQRHPDDEESFAAINDSLPANLEKKTIHDRSVERREKERRQRRIRKRKQNSSNSKSRDIDSSQALDDLQGTAVINEEVLPVSRRHLARLSRKTTGMIKSLSLSQSD